MDGGLSRRFRMGLNDPQLVNAVFEELRQRIGENNYNTQRWLADHKLQQSELGVAISRVSGDDLSRQMALSEIARAMALNQINMRAEVEKLLNTLLSRAEMTDKQLSDKLEAIRNEIAVPAEDLKNIKWVRNFLRKASTVEGEDLGEKKES